MSASATQGGHNNTLNLSSLLILFILSFITTGHFSYVYVLTKLKAKFHYAIMVADRSQAGRRLPQTC